MLINLLLFLVGISLHGSTLISVNHPKLSWILFKAAYGFNLITFSAYHLIILIGASMRS